MGWPKGKPRGPRKPRQEGTGAATKKVQLKQADPKPSGYYRNTRKAAVFCSQGRVEFGEAVPLDAKEAAVSSWWEPCQKPD